MEQTRPSDGRRKVAVLGGGTGALFAVLAITAQADWRDHYDITIYQVGWRLGGKGASSRDAGHRFRNEEHGLHILGGFYHNGFRWLRDAYREWGVIDPQFAIAFGDAFFKQNSFTLQEKAGSAWQQIRMLFPPDDRVPGLDPSDPDLGAVIRRILAGVRDCLGKLFGDPAEDTAAAKSVFDGLDQPIAAAGAAFSEAFSDFWQTGASSDHVDLAADVLVLVLEKLRDMLLVAESLSAIFSDDSTSPRKPDPLVLMEIATIIAIGLLRDRVYRLGYDAIEDFELREWGRRHGATERILESAYQRAGYDFVFGFAGGITDPPNYSMSAGVAMRWGVRMMLTWHGALFWHMAGGMGEIVFAPLYAVLRARGVRFAFFHRVRRLCLEDGQPLVQAVEFDVQASLKDEASSYEPLIPHGNRRVWPTRPNYDQLVDGETLQAWGDDLECLWTPRRNEKKRRLERGRDFDLVVLGISVGALPEICAELGDRIPKWKTMLAAARTIPAAGVQVWSLPTTADLGWKGPRPGLVTAYGQPFSTWADMSFLLKLENSEDGVWPQHLSYFCAPIERLTPQDDKPGSSFPKDEAARVRSCFEAWLPKHLPYLLPDAMEGGRPAPDYLWDMTIRANVSPSDHYVLSPPGGRLKRLHAGNSHVENLYLAGDWTRTGLDAGCFEAAVMSGLQCAAALTGREIEVHAGEAP
jgi:uncharacterized protein with NAD-binding domain and iron-sulfur cluster